MADSFTAAGFGFSSTAHPLGASDYYDAMYDQQLSTVVDYNAAWQNSTGLGYAVTMVPRTNAPVTPVPCPKLEQALVLLRDPLAKQPTELRTAIIIFYVVAAAFGALGNLLVIATVIRNPQMRTPRNLFIINLALSDLSMCTITVPFTMKFLLDNFWDLGRVMCRVVSSLQGINVFVSTLSIAAIGLDRYLVILFPARAEPQKFALGVCFLSTWLVSVMLAVPMYLTTDISPVNHFNMRERCGIYVDICMEVDVFGPEFRRIYTICCFVFQYFLPLLTLTFVYSRIICRLQRRVVFRVTTADTVRRREAEGRQTRMNVLLVAILLVFALSWLPLNIYMTIVSFKPDTLKTEIFALVHMLGMTSACANPILYGLLNENFRREFREIFNIVGLRILIEKICPNCSCLNLGSGSASIATRSREQTSTFSPSTHSYRLNISPRLKHMNGEFLAVPSQLNGSCYANGLNHNSHSYFKRLSLPVMTSLHSDDLTTGTASITPSPTKMTETPIQYSSDEQIPLNPYRGSDNRNGNCFHEEEPDSGVE